jgi:hypothetical protein
MEDYLLDEPASYLLNYLTFMPISYLLLATLFATIYGSA